ncbi:MAG TPA: tRNA pseudouridine(55) synthase TruB [Dehalococcoidia bacterium]|nr:tRNA pseudouridine(55) synthase TruB [Dehalococcoidia bacterium]
MIGTRVLTVSGILNVNKEPGETSFGVVGYVRRRSGVRRVGHAGTLDPAATGVLLVCLGQAARVSEYLMALHKTYRATVRLGVSTTTYDAEGDVTRSKDASGMTEGAVRDALKPFVGEIMQTPPAYSAVKVGGERAYRIARRGETVALKARPAHIYGIEVLRCEAPELEIGVECGKGTYIRSLAHDLGEALGCGAHLSALCRTRVGPFDIDDAVDRDALEAAFDDGTWTERVLPMDYGLQDLPGITLHIEDEKDIRHGQAVRIDEDRLSGVQVKAGLECRAYAEVGSLVGIIVFDEEIGMWRPRKVFG